MWLMQTQLEPPVANQARRENASVAKRSRANRITRILVPIDFSRVSLRAVPYALAVSRQYRANVHLLHAVDTTQYLSRSLLSLSAPIRAEVNERLMKRLQTVASRYNTDGAMRELRPREGSPFKEICTAAQQVGADLIVIATHGYTGYRRAFLGSTAERVVQHSHIPVLVVRRPLAHRNGAHEQRTRTEFRLRKILVPTDFSKCARVAFDYAVELARDFKAELRLVHVINPNAYPFGDEFAALHAARLMREGSQASQKQMRKMASSSKLPYSVRVEHGLPAREICEAANEDVDLIVTSTHGRTSLSHVLIGSTAEHIVRYARCPVLVIPARNHFH